MKKEVMQMTTQPSKEEILAGMDDSAKEAEAEFRKIEEDNPAAAATIAEWWRKHFGNAGHKRLAYILMHKPMHERR